MYLNCHSYFSLRYGTLSIEKLVESAKALGITALALTDINNSTGIMDFVKICKENGIKPIAGIEFRQGDELLYIGLAKNNEGFRELNEFLTHYTLRNQPLPAQPLEFENVVVICPVQPAVGSRQSAVGSRQSAVSSQQSAPHPQPPGPFPPLLKERGKGGEVDQKWSERGPGGEVDQKWSKRGPGGEVDQKWYKRGQSGRIIGLRPADLNKLRFSRNPYQFKNAVILAPVTFTNVKEFELHRNLRAIDNNILLSRLTPQNLASPDERMMRVDDLLHLYREFPQVIKNTEKLIDECHIDFDNSAGKNKKSFTGSRYDDKILLEKLAYDGLEYRYGKHHKEAERRIVHELGIIDKMGFSPYFLIAWDIIRYSMSRGFYHVGRGSGANSIVAYCLKITDVDPIELDLYFERFINPKRTSPPDFDIDYSWKERDTVLDYIFKRYGHQFTALLGAMSTFKGNSIYRELGKVHGLPKQEMDNLLKNPDAVANQSNIVQKISEIGAMMVDFPNIRSIHAGGVLISDEPITCYTALDLPPKGFPTTQWDMYVAEEIGFEKLDILSQRGIGHIKEAAEIILENRSVNVDVHAVQLFKKDERVKQQLRSGETIGCFYVESPAMRGLLKKLHCDNYRTLVAASSIIRPGVARSGMMKEYIYRFHNPDKFKYMHPVMEEQLKETYGVMVYQEDVLKICHHFAGLDLADADVIRRAMSGKYRSKKELQRIIDKFFENCRNFGYPEEVTKEVWRQIESFAGYSFSKAHSASYAVESYQSLYLKAHYPLEFMVGVINNFGGFYPSWVYFNEARNCGATLHLPCVNRGNFKTAIAAKDIFIGFVHVANLENNVAKNITNERKINGEYHGLEDFIRRTGTTLEQLIILIRIGAFRFTVKTKSQLLWEAHMLQGKQSAVGSRQSAVGSRQSAVGSQQRSEATSRAQRGIPVGSQQSAVYSRQSAVGSQNPELGTANWELQTGNSIVNRQSEIVNPVLFYTSPKKFDLPALEQSIVADVYDEVELLGFPIKHTYFDLLETSFRGEVFAREMMDHIGKKVRMLGQLVTIKYVRTIKKEWMHFGTFTDINGHFFDTVHFPKAVNAYPFRGDGIYLVLGRIVEEFGFPSLEVEKMAKMPLKKDPRA